MLGGTAAGVVAALVLTLLLPSTYRADASIALTKQGQPPSDDPELAQAAEAATELFDSRAVADSAISNLRLDESPNELLDRVSIETEPKSSLVRLRVEAGSPEEARRLAQELTEVSTVLFNDRFGPATVAQIWETPRADEQRVSPRPARNLALGALLGALAGIALLARGRLPRGLPSRPAVPWLRLPTAPRLPRLPTAPRLPKPRRAPARMLPPPERTPPAAPLPAPAAAAAWTASEPEPEPEPAPTLPPPPPAVTGPFVMPVTGEWTLTDVERLLADHGPAFPDLVDELRFYVETFREVVEPDGHLPGGVEAVAADVFAPLIQRARTLRA